MARRERAVGASPWQKIAEVALEWCRGRGVRKIASCVVDNGYHRYGFRVCTYTPFWVCVQNQVVPRASTS